MTYSNMNEPFIAGSRNLKPLFRIFSTIYKYGENHNIPCIFFISFSFIFFYHKMAQKDAYGSIESVPITQEDADLLQASKPGYGTRSVLEVSLNIVNATVGSGIIGLPFALLMAGFTTGIAISAFVSILTFFAIYSLVLTGQKSQIYDFASLAKLAMGQFGFHMLNLMLFIQSAGSVISYFICE